MPSRAPLADKMIDVYKKSEFDGDREFVPAYCLDKMLTQKAVIDELGVDEDATKVKELASWIVKSCQKIFATTILCGFKPPSLFSVMQEFMIKGFDDANLPVQYADENDDNRWPDCFQTEHWSRLSRRSFKWEQWKVQVPIFEDAKINVSLHKDQILPIISSDENPREGAFGTVYQVTIHPDHIESPMRKVRFSHE